MIPFLRVWLTKFVAKLRRKGQRVRDSAKAEECARTGRMETWTRYKAPKAPATCLEGQYDRTLWSGQLRQHFSSVYTDNSPATAT
eukprot:8473338-Heterocapsa_arctica.AAC.1